MMAAVPPITDCWAPRGSIRNRPELISLSSIIAPQAPKLIFDLHHQNLREKAANFNWRADSLISKVKRAFGSCLAGVLEFITLGALLLAG
jgi:predicted translin family RNA/ssDNA-binding protein